uniref:Uncharacterized protein n=1 Tax=Anguilla anguilla TaxID=7936 RepID=A0A0E9SH25_ANGAN
MKCNLLVRSIFLCSDQINGTSSPIYVAQFYNSH